MPSVRSDRRTSIVTCLLVVAFGTVTGCARRGTYLEDPVGETHTPSSSTAGARPQGVDEPRSAIGVVVTEELREACGLPRRQQAARFSFDGRRLRPNGEDDLAGVVRCLASDRLGEASLVIVGHTDPRGEEDYSEKLGMHRADAAREYLVDRGIAHERIAIRSQGARDAKGTNESSWALDRFVELRLAEPRSQAGMAIPKFDGAGTGTSGRAQAPEAARPAAPVQAAPPAQTTAPTVPPPPSPPPPAP
jgi:outer membrane protein OmpA-like peptidoglycan-associated protein